MWMPKLKWPHLGFISLHYLYIVGLGVLAFVILYPAGNLSSTDAFFFGASASTESGLNTQDVNNLYLYQQVVLYFIPILGNMQVVSIMVVIFRFLWFRKQLKSKASVVRGFKEMTQPERSCSDSHAEAKEEALIRAHSWTVGLEDDQKADIRSLNDVVGVSSNDTADLGHERNNQANHTLTEPANGSSPTPNSPTYDRESTRPLSTRIRFAPETHPRKPDLSDRKMSSEGQYSYELDEKRGQDFDPDHAIPETCLERVYSGEGFEATMRLRNRRGTSQTRSRAASSDRINLQRIVTNMFELGGVDHAPIGQRRHRTMDFDLRRTPSRESSGSRKQPRRASKIDKLKLSTNAVLGRNSHFSNLTSEDKDRLGGIEYRSLKLLLKVILSYYISLHLTGIICLTPWIFLTQEAKYRQYLTEKGINYTWWSIYSAGTMANNLGFTLTPDSMISFRDAVFPILIMTLLAYAGHTFYPICLRVVIWTLSRLYSKDHELQEPLRFLLDHPRRCYLLLFPRRQTWILAGVLVALNVVDVILIICLDLNNPEVTMVPLAPRFISSIFQAASSRHTGTSTFNLANVSPGVQFSLLTMMYISIFPISISVRSSNTYEESSLGVFEDDEVDPTLAANSKSYFMAHVRNQLSFDLWYIFLGCFCICCAEADRISDKSDPTFQVFPIFFEVASAYANVGLSLGYPTVSTSLSGVFNQFSKLVICAMMIRGRHRGLPVKLDRAVVLPSERFSVRDLEALPDTGASVKRLPRLKQTHTH